MIVAITGATGLLGANLAEALAEAGHALRCTRRGSSRVDHVDHLPIHWVEADLSDGEALRRAFDGVELVFHCAAMVSILRRVTPALTEANVAGTRRVVEAARAAGVRRLLHCSSTVAVGMRDDGTPADERDAWNFDRYGLDDGYATTKRQAEQVVQEQASAGLDAVIVNPGYMFGPYDVRPSSGRLLLDLVRGRVPGSSSGCNSFVGARDVARGMIAAAERGQAGERYILAGENLSYEQLFARVAAVAGTRPPRLRVPRALAQVAALGGDLAEWLTQREPSLTSNTVAWAYQTRFVVSSEKARAALGYQPRPLEAAVAEALRWFRDRGMVGPLPNFP